MKKTFKKIAASVMAVATLAVSAAGMSASAVSTTGSATYGSCKYTLTVSNCYATGTLKNNGTSTRYSTIKLYVASSQNGTALSGKNGNGSSNLGSGSTLTVSRDQSGHSSAYKHFYRGDLYGSSSGANVPIVETTYLKVSG